MWHSQISFRAGRYQLDIVSALAEKGLDQFTVSAGTDTFEVPTRSKEKVNTSNKQHADMAFISRANHQHPPPRRW